MDISKIQLSFLDRMIDLPFGGQMTFHEAIEKGIRGFPLFDATKTIDEIKFLLDHKLVNVNDISSFGDSLFIKARSVEEVNFLVKAGIDLESRNYFGQTALFNTESPKIVKALLDAGADINALSSEGRKVIHETRENLDCLKILISEGVDIEAKDDNGMTLLHLLCDETYEYDVDKEVEIVRFLLQSGVDYTALDNAGNDAKYYARDKPEILTVFNEFGI